MENILIYYPFEENRRLSFAARHIFENTLGIGFSIVDRREAFLNYVGPAINYSKENLDKGLQIIPKGLLEETGISPKKALKVSEWKTVFCFFSEERGDIPFDLFSATFYLLSSYEEYGSAELDEHGRFNYHHSLLFTHNCLEIPVVDRWAYLLKEEIFQKYPGTKFNLRKFRFVSTFDIDFPYQYRKRKLIRRVGGMAKDLIQLRFGDFIKRIAVYFHWQEDPYRKAIQNINDFHEKNGKIHTFFILLDSKGKYGNAADFPLTDYYKNLPTLKLATIGLHPSYNTYKNLELLIKEKQKLGNLLNRKITSSRQHFLRMNVPATFQELAIAGIQNDFSLLFAKAPGFRSGTAIPYSFYDIEKESVTNLTIHPTCVMDSTFIFHLKTSPEESLQRIKSLIDECKKSGGDYISLWHNSNLAGSRSKNPWIDVFTASFAYASAFEKND